MVKPQAAEENLKKAELAIGAALEWVEDAAAVSEWPSTGLAGAAHCRRASELLREALQEVEDAADAQHRRRLSELGGSSRLDSTAR